MVVLTSHQDVEIVSATLRIVELGS
jgi:hypothetical protein